MWTIRQLRAFIGLASYYRRFIKDFASVARPLHNLLKKNVSYKWEQEQQVAFDKLKEHLTSAPVLQYPDFSRTFFLHTDASGTGLGAVLAQKVNRNKDHHRASRVHNNADALSRRQEPTKERLESERFKTEKEKDLQEEGEQTDLEWLLNFAEYGENEDPWRESTDDKEVKEEWDWWDIYEDEDRDNNGDEEEITSESDQEYTWIRSESEKRAIEELNEIHDRYYLEVVSDRTMTTKMNH
ncbi:12557_t:CDS:2 [Cetraspora pellucida]|uniref:12557_t:CDS:1 n=1 Tax=Cetraspora pellucida TaxID=1433469 RepID=A0ACA9KSM0_9GLOM|nr:12557_t:CDS:2 [Cetraspora pellucida]